MDDQAIQDEARRIVARAARREQRRVRMLAVFTIGLWFVAALLITSMALPAMAKMKKVGILLKQPGPDGQPMSAQQIADLLAVVLPGTLYVATIMLAMAMLAGLLASICTVALSFTIRRVTLRQVNEGLAQISAQLRELKDSARPG